MIEVSGLVKTYSDGARTIKPIDNVDFSCRKGELILILGRSGSGKTTFLNILGGLIRPTKGKILIDGRDIASLSDKSLSSIRSRSIGFVFQFPGLLSTLTALENVAIPARIAGNPEASTCRALQLLTRVGLREKANCMPSQMSGGELKRTAIARALMNNPSIILADEPTADLDVDTEREIMVFFSEIMSEGTTIIMVTHNSDLASHASRVLRMENGKLIEA
jgi:ABC-type lipoprotein export system ATPase subunit